MATNIINARLGCPDVTVWADWAWQYDYGQILKVSGVDLPDAYEVHFSNQETGGITITQIGNADGVTVPDEFFLSGENIYVFIFLHAGLDDGETVYKVVIPVKDRPQPSDEEPTPVQQSAIDQAIAALNDAVEQTAQDAGRAEAAAQLLENPGAEAETLPTGSPATASYSEGVFYFGLPRGEKGEQGQAGQDGADGFSPIANVTQADGVTTISITDEIGTTTASIDMNDKADVITDTASGSIVSIPDGMSSPVLGLDVDIEPIQDLHGYDNPWPAGGGKNKFDISKMSNTADITVSNGIITVTGNTKNSGKKLSELADLVVGETYTLSAITDGSESIIYLYGTGANVSWGFDYTLTITQAHLDALVFFYGGENATAHISDFMIRLSSVTDSSFAPYSNICPISGRTSVTINHSGADTSDPEQVTIQLGQTVYGGTVDVTSGLMTVDKAILDLGDLTYAYDATYTRFISSQVSNIKESGTGARSTYLLSSMFLGIYDGRGIALVPDNSVYCGGNNEKVIYIKTSLYTDKDLFKSFVTGQKLVYPISPIEVQLTPTEISILQGTNNIWADSGDTTVEYRADTKLWILKKIAQALNS